MLLRKNDHAKTDYLILVLSLSFNLVASYQRLTEEEQENEEEDIEEETEGAELEEYNWLFLSLFLIFFFAVTMVLFYLLYSPVSRWALMRAYKTRGISVPARVVSSEFLSEESYNTIAIYAVSSNRIASAGNNIEFTGGHNKKRYTRSFQFPDESEQGSVLEIIYLPEKGESGILKETVHERMSKYSISQTVLTILLGIPLLTLIFILAFNVCQYEDRAYEVMALSIVLTILIGYLLSSYFWRKERSIEYFAAEVVDQDMEKALAKMAAKDPKKLPLLP
mmetsp:Transcript_19298/g.28552  ORF Transcript_19298/g.28552 Transcript_19298/m.28552 type:complete len:279 (-) Transcript_19298:4137-4973(-)